MQRSAFLIDEIGPSKQDEFNAMYTKYLSQQPQDNQLWGTPAALNLQENYLQPSADRDDENSHSARVRRRQTDARLAYQSPNQARELFDKLWKTNDADRLEETKQRDPRNQTGFISIKTNFGEQKVSIYPYHRNEDNDQWGRPENLRK